MSYTVEKVWPYKGYTCVVIMTELGHRCGYVGVSTKHPLYGKDYHKSCRCLTPLWKDAKEKPFGKRGVMTMFAYKGDKKVSPELFFDVHGSLTFSSRKKNEDYPVTQPHTWWFGYDCGHAGDGKDLSVLSPTLREIEEKFPRNDPVRSLEYCIGECESLAEQLISVEK